MISARLGFLRGASVPSGIDIRTLGANVGYSLRSLTAAYSGPVVQVRRSSDNAESTFTAADVASGALTSWVGGGNGFVKTWYDQSANANHATQATAANQPQIVASGSLVTSGGKPAIYFDSSLYNTRLDMTAITAGTAFLVGQSKDTLVIEYVLGGSGRGVGFGAGQGYGGFAFNGSLTSAGTYSIGARAIIAAFTAASTKTVFYNSSSGTGTTPLLTGISRIGDRADLTGLGMRGPLQEIVTWSGDMLASRTTITNDINSYYSVF